MPELFDLDHLDDAFEALTHDVGAQTRAPGAERATRSARRRRTTKLVAGVAALAVVAGGGVGLLQHRSDHDVVDPADGMPAPAPLSVDVLNSVTAGWISGWTEPSSGAHLPTDLNAAGDACLSSFLGDENDNGVASYGASAFVSGHSIAFSRGMALKTEATAQRLMATPSSSSACTDVRTTAPAPDTELVTARASDSNGHAVFAVARWHERLAFIGVSDPTHADPATVQAALGDALLAAIQEESTVSVMSGITSDTFVDSSGSASGSGSSGQPSYSMTAPTGADLQQAFGAWAAGYDPNGNATRAVATPGCLLDTAESGSGETVGSAALVGLSSYGSSTEAGDGLNSIAKSLTGCGFRVEGSWTAGPLMATRSGDKPMTLWFVQSGPHVASVLLDGTAEPPQAVTDAVDQLLTTAIATVRVEPSGQASGQAPAAVMSASAAG